MPSSGDAGLPASEGHGCRGVVYLQGWSSPDENAVRRDSVGGFEESGGGTQKVLRSQLQDWRGDDNSSERHRRLHHQNPGSLGEFGVSAIHQAPARAACRVLGGIGILGEESRRSIVYCVYH